MGFIEDVLTYDELTDTRLQKYLDEKGEKSKKILTLEVLVQLVADELCNDMSDSNAKSRIQTHVNFHHTVLRRHDLTWFVKETRTLRCIMSH